MTATAPAQLRLTFDPPPAIIRPEPDAIIITRIAQYEYTTDYARTLEAEMERKIAAGKPLYAEALAIVDQWFPQLETLKIQDQRFLQSWRQFLDRGEDCYHRIGEMRMTWLRRINEELEAKDRINDII